MKVKVKTTGEIIDVHFSHNYNSGGSNEKVYSDSFTGKYYYASELEQLTGNTMIDGIKMKQEEKELLLSLLLKADEESSLHIYDSEDNIYSIDWLFIDNQICMKIKID